MSAISLEILFAATVTLIIIAIWLGYKIGNTYSEQKKKEREKISSTGVTAILGMLAFLMAFVFGIAYDRYDYKKTLVRDEANVIRTAWLRSDFLPEKDRNQGLTLFKEYIDLRISAVQSKDKDILMAAIKESNLIQHQLWDMAVENARIDMNSDVAALYIESLNEMLNYHATRMGVGLLARLPDFIWVVLYLLVFLGMFGLGYQISLSESKIFSWLTPVMVLTFSLILVLISSLDRPQEGFVTIPQEPLIELRKWMDTGSWNP